MRNVVKDGTISFRLNSAIIEEIKEAAAELHLSVPNFMVKMFQDYKENAGMAYRLKAVERIVYSKFGNDTDLLTDSDSDVA